MLVYTPLAQDIFVHMLHKYIWRDNLLIMNLKTLRGSDSDIEHWFSVMQERICSLSLEQITMAKFIKNYLCAKGYFIISGEILLSVLNISVALAFTFLWWTETELTFGKCFIFHCHYSNCYLTTSWSYHLLQAKGSLKFWK